MKMKNLMIYALLLLPIGLMAQCTSEKQEQKADENVVVKTIMERRSVRKYLDKPVEHDKLATMVECGINAPNGMNQQPWEVRVVES